MASVTKASLVHLSVLEPDFIVSAGVFIRPAASWVCVIVTLVDDTGAAAGLKPPVGWLYCSTFRTCCVAQEPDWSMLLMDFPPCQTPFLTGTQVSSSNVRRTTSVVPVWRLTSFSQSPRKQQTLAGTHEAEPGDVSLLVFVEGSEVGRLRPGGRGDGFGGGSRQGFIM